MAEEQTIEITIRATDIESFRRALARAAQDLRDAINDWDLFFIGGSHRRRCALAPILPTLREIARVTASRPWHWRVLRTWIQMQVELLPTY